MVGNIVGWLLYCSPCSLFDSTLLHDLSKYSHQLLLCTFPLIVDYLQTFFQERLMVIRALFLLFASNTFSLSHKIATVHRLFLLTVVSCKKFRGHCSVSGKMLELCFLYTPSDSISQNFDTISSRLHSLENAFTFNVLFLFPPNNIEPSFTFKATVLFSFPMCTSVYICNIGLLAPIKTKISLLLLKGVN